MPTGATPPNNSRLSGGIATAAEAISYAVEGAGLLVGLVRGIVRALIAHLVATLAAIPALKRYTSNSP
jgi:uncharacterized membrane protein required for colicin V production